MGLYDIEPIKSWPTWSNKRIMEERISKILDRFPIEGKLDRLYCQEMVGFLNEDFKDQVKDLEKKNVGICWIKGKLLRC